MAFSRGKVWVTSLCKLTIPPLRQAMPAGHVSLYLLTNFRQIWRNGQLWHPSVGGWGKGSSQSQLTSDREMCMKGRLFMIDFPTPMTTTVPPLLTA